MYKVLIRPLVIEDASISWKWRNDPVIWKYTGKKPDIYITEEIEKKWLAEKLAEINSTRFAITVDDIYVGNIQLTNIRENESAEYHIFIGDKTYWGKGIASLATSQILRYAKNLLRLKTIYLSVNPENFNAIKLYEKAGFKKVNDNVVMKLELRQFETPVVSIFMMTFNHEEFISEAIEGVLMQKTNFDYEIVIGEDCSTDNTREIILSYQKKYPGKFKLLLHEKNIGAVANQMAIFQACVGKYIALCEGDDYWTDPLKLQKQVDFLEGNPEYGLVHTDFDIHEIISGNYARNVIALQKPKMEWQEGSEFVRWYTGGYTKIITCTVCFRKSIYDRFYSIEDLQNVKVFGDIVLFCTIGGNSKVKYFSESTAVKNNLPESASQSQNFKKKIENSVHIANAFSYFANKYNIKKKYYMSYQKAIKYNILKTGILKNDKSVFKFGLTSTLYNLNLIEKMLFSILFCIYPYLRKFNKLVIKR